jgi:hypothetical protein
MRHQPGTWIAPISLLPAVSTTWMPSEEVSVLYTRKPSALTTIDTTPLQSTSSRRTTWKVSVSTATNCFPERV